MRPMPPARRGARLVAIGPPDSELQRLAERARAPFIPVPRRAPARASIWALTVPVLLAARTLGLVKVNEADLAETAARLDADADRCRPGSRVVRQPGEGARARHRRLDPDRLGLVAAGDGRRPPVRATRSSSNARYPVVAGALGEAGRGRVGLLDGVFGGAGRGRARHLRRSGRRRGGGRHDSAADHAAARRRPGRRQSRRQRAGRRRGTPCRRGRGARRTARHPDQRDHRARAARRWSGSRRWSPCRTSRRSTWRWRMGSTRWRSPRSRR